MIFVELFVKIYRELFEKDQLGGQHFYPAPHWLKRLWSTWPATQRIVIYARLVKGADLSFIVPDDVACAETVTRITRGADAFPTKIIPGTWTLWDELRRSRRCKRVSESEIKGGDIIISPTGTSRLGRKAPIVGHVGIIDIDRKSIISSNSYTGKVDTTYSISTWKKRYRDLGHFPIYFFRILK